MYLSKLINVFIPVAKHICPKGCAKWNWGFWQTTVLTPVLHINIAIYIWKILFLLNFPHSHNHSQPFSSVLSQHQWITETLSLIKDLISLSLWEVYVYILCGFCVSLVSTKFPTLQTFHCASAPKLLWNDTFNSFWVAKANILTAEIFRRESPRALIARNWKCSW